MNGKQKYDALRTVADRINRLAHLPLQDSASAPARDRRAAGTAVIGPGSRIRFRARTETKNGVIAAGSIATVLTVFPALCVQADSGPSAGSLYWADAAVIADGIDIVGQTGTKSKLGGSSRPPFPSVMPPSREAQSVEFSVRLS